MSMTEYRYDPVTGQAKEREIDGIELAFRNASFREQVDTFNMQREVIATLTESEANQQRYILTLEARLGACESATRELLAQNQTFQRRGW
jgi:molybdopterin biosynthesis enzyme MoaB